MDSGDAIIPYIPFLAGGGILLGLLGIIGWVYTTHIRVKNGYPLDGGWGQAIYPKTSDETIERVKLLSQENAQLRAELGSLKDRLVVVERIVTDDAHGLNREIENLRSKTN